MVMTIKRIDDVTFAAITDTVLSDGSVKADYGMRLVGNLLKSHEQRGYIRVGGLMKIQLGPQSYTLVTSLAIGESVVLGK